MKNLVLCIILIFGFVLFGFSEQLENTFSHKITFKPADLDLSVLENVRILVNKKVKDNYYNNMSPSASMIVKMSKEFNIPVHLALALVKTESNFDAKAINHNRNGSIDYGLMQLNSFTFSNLTAKELLDPETNISCGLNYLREMYDMLGNWNDAIVAYNAGPYRVEKKIAPAISVIYMYRILNTEQEWNVKFLNLKDHA